MKLIDKDALVAEIERLIELFTIPQYSCEYNNAKADGFREILSFIDTIEVKDPYEQCVQYPSIKDGIEAHAKIYSFNIESQLFPQLTKEQQVLWRKEIEQACINGGDAGVTLARDQRYKENLEVKEVGLIKEVANWKIEHQVYGMDETFYNFAKHFFGLGLKVAQK